MVAAFGVPLFERAAFLRRALDSLLAQTLPDFGVVLVDDCSSDESYAIAAEYAASDPRVVAHRNERRLGLAANWRRAHDLARAEWPGARWFAWGSDHDEWHPEWLEALAAELDAHPQAVLAYPRSERIAAAGERVRATPGFSTAGVRSPRARLWRVAGAGSAGSIVYGLFRAEALARAGPFPAAAGGDRLLLARLALLGEFHEVPRVLWRRRFDDRPSARSQRAALFPGRPPVTAYLPWPVVHAVALARSEAGIAAAAPYALRSAARAARTGTRRALGRLRRRVAAGRSGYR